MMAMFLTARDTGERVNFPLLPDRLKITDAAGLIGYTLLKTGGVRLPRGCEPTGFGWSGILPGAHARRWTMMADWSEPTEIERALRGFLRRGAVLQLMITELNLVEDVFIETFEANYAGGAGDIHYAIKLAKYRAIGMKSVPMEELPPDTSGAQAAGGDAGDGKKYGTVRLNDKNSRLNVRKGAGTKYAVIGKLKHGAKVELIKKSGSWYQIPYSGGKNWVHGSYIKVISQPVAVAATTSAPVVKQATYTVVSGDSLYKIAKAKWGAGSRYLELYSLNRADIDARNKGKSVDRYTVYPGQVLKLA